MGIRDAVLPTNEKNRHYVNVVVTPTIVLPPSSMSQKQETKTKAKPATKTPSISQKKRLVKAREDARANVASNVKTRVRQLKKKT